MRDSGCHGNRRRGNFVPKSANGHQFSCGEKQSAGCFRRGSTDIRVKNLLACEPPFRSTALRGCSRHGSARTAPSARRLALAEKAPLNGWDLCARWQRRPRIDRDVVGFQNGIAAAVFAESIAGGYDAPCPALIWWTVTRGSSDKHGVESRLCAFLYERVSSQEVVGWPLSCPRDTVAT